MKNTNLGTVYSLTLRKLKKFCKNPRVIAVYVFGSFLEHPSKARDVDLCFITEKMDSDEMTEISMQFDAPIDVSFMERMPYTFAIQVFRNGKPILVNNQSRLSKKWLYVVSQHLEHAGMRERIFRGVLRWMSFKTPST